MVRWWVAWTLAMTICVLLPTRADNPCVDNPYYTGWSCQQPGVLLNGGTLTGATNITITTGSPITAPSISGVAYTNGVETEWLIHTCPGYQNQQFFQPDVYTTNVYFSPSVPSTIWVPGTYQYVAHSGIASVDGVCAATNTIIGVFTIIVQLGTNSSPCLAPPTNLVSWWQGESNALDSVGSNNGMTTNGAGFAPGEVGRAFSFNGVNQYVRIPQSPSLNFSNQVTVEFWMEADHNNAMNSYQGLVISDFWGVEIANGYAAGPLGVNFLISTDSGGGGPSSYNYPDTATVNGGGAVISAGIWHHVAGTYDGTKLQLYIDGQPWGRPNYHTGAISPMLTNSFVTIGSEDGRTVCPGCVASRYFNGLIDEVCVYNRALSTNEILAIYNAGAAGKCACIPAFFYSQPTNQNVVADGTATLTVAAGGTQPLSYQWLFNGNSLSDGSGISGTHTSALTLSNVQPAEAGSYTVQVMNPCGSIISSNAVLTVLGPLGCNPAPSGLVAWWRGEGDTTNEIAPAGGAGVIYNAVGFGPGEVGQGFSFGYEDDSYIYFPNPSLNSIGGSGMTLEFWMNPDSIDGGEGPIPLMGWQTSPDSGVYPYVGFSDGYWGNIEFGIGSGVLSDPGIITAGVWQHVAVTYDSVSGEAVIYVNGIQVAANNVGSGALPQSSAYLYVGDVALSGNDYNGGIDEISLYNRVLSTSEIQGIYNAGFAGKCTGSFTPPAITLQPLSCTNVAGTTATFVVNASGTIPLNYQWYFNGNPLTGATGATLTLENVQPTNAGNYSVTVSNLAGSVSSILAGLTVLVPPTVSLVSPANGQNFNANYTNVVLVAAVGDADASVIRVDFYNNGTNLLGSAYTSPYAVTLAGSYGGYSLTAVATDSYGLTATSSVVNITVDVPPAANITSPAGNLTVVTPTNLTISATGTVGGSGSEWGVTVAQLQLFAGANLLGTTSGSSLSLVWSNAPPGTWNLTAVATDSLGVSSTSSVVTVTINPLTNLTAIADAHVRDGSYSNVNFGASTVLEVQSSIGTSTNRDAYLKFDLSNLSSNISSATLSVFGSVSTNSGTVTNVVYAVTNSTWLENTITWSNKPARGAALGTNILSGTNGSWYVYDVSGFVRSQKTAGSNWVSLALHDRTNTTRLVTFNSRENTTNNPVLTVITTNSPPTVNISSPANNAVYVAPAASITVSATASDDGSVAQIQFFAGSTSLGTVTPPANSVIWNNVPAGTYSLTAVATDNENLSSTSNPVNIIVDIPPVVTLTNLTNGEVFIAGTNISVGAAASDADGTVTRVQFFQGTTSLGIDATAPYQTNWNNVGVGNYTLTAVATDNNGVTSTSPPVNIIVDTFPTVSITSPASNATFADPTNITITATASSNDGSLPQVQFYAGGVLLGTDTSPPYSAVWNNPPVGRFVLTAIATDDYGLASTVTVTNITFVTNLMAIADAHVRDGSYSNINFGTNIILEVQSSSTGGTNRDTYLKFDVSNLSSNIGSAQLQIFGSVSTNAPVTNTVYAVADTTWVETSITWSNKPARGTALSTNVFNGTNGTWYTYDLTGYIRSQRTSGSNWVSLALHQPINSTRLVSINSRENASNNPVLVVVMTNPPPSIVISSPANNSVYVAPVSLTVSATANDSSGVTWVQFFAGTNSLGVVTGPPYSVPWNNVPAGNYALSAVAADNYGMTARSAVINVTMQLMTVIIDSPTNGAVLQ